MLEIDGSFLEGGGAITRNAVALSAITQKPIHIFNIRAGRRQPGLKIQHLEGIKAVAELCDGELKGAEVGSKEVWFYPKKIRAKELDVKISTAGSIGLLFQTIAIPASQASDKVIIKVSGGADFGKWSSAVLWLKNVLLPILNRMGYRAEIELLRHGFYPCGGAQVIITVWPCKLFNSLKLAERGEAISIDGISVASKLLEKAKVAERQASAAEKALFEHFKIKPSISIEYCDSPCAGCGLVVWLKTDKGAVLGSDIAGERGVRAESLGEKVAENLIKDYESSAVDRYATDQLIPFLALAQKSSIKVPEITKHAETNIWVVEKFLPVKFKIDREKRIITV